MQNSYEEQSKQHADLVASLQNEIHDRDQRIHRLEQSLEEREQQLRANQMQANEAVWAKDGLLREQTNELASLRRERDAAVAEQKAAISQFEADRSDYTAQIEHLKEQVHDTERHRQEAEEQNRTSQDMLLFKDNQLQEAQGWMARSQELDLYVYNLNIELRERNDQLNQLWIGFQRQLADGERYHAQVIQRLQAELAEAREQSQLPKGSGKERLGARDERQIQSGNHVDLLQREGNEETSSKAAVTNNGGVVRGNPIILSHGNMEASVPVYIPLDKVEHATGLLVGPSSGVVGSNPMLASVGMPVMQQYGIQQQPLASVAQISPIIQTSFPQLHGHHTVLSTPQHHPSAQHQNAQQQQQQQSRSTEAAHHTSTSSLPKHFTQPGQPQQKLLDREEGQQHGGILLSQLSKTQAPVSSVQKSQKEATVPDTVKPSRDGQQVQLLSHSSQDQKQTEHSLQYHAQSNSQPERQRQEQQQHSQSHEQVTVQHDEARQLQHQQGISSSMHNLSQATTTGTEENHVQHKPPPSKTIMVKQEPSHPATAPANPQQIASEPIKNPEPALLDERALLACLIRAVPAEANAKISLKSTLPNRLGKMLAPLHWQHYRKQYGRLDEFVSSHKELFVIEDDYIYLREGAHAKVSATTAVAKAAAAAAAASPVGLDGRLPTVAVTPVAQASHMQRGKNNPKTGLNKDDRARPPPQEDNLNIHKQRSMSPQHAKSGSGRQNSASRGHAGSESAVTNSGGKPDSGSNTTGEDFSSATGNTSSVPENSEANSYGSSRGAGYHGTRQPSSRNSYAGTGQYRKQDNHYRSQNQDSRSTSAPSQ
jgi:hypothetical protein